MKGRQEAIVIIPQAEEKFKRTDDRYFESRIVQIKADSIELKIEGKENAATGREMRIENTDNPNPLSIMIEDGVPTISIADENVLHVSSGDISITSEKDFEPLRELKKKKELKRKVRDPDVVRIDGRIYRQTGTLHLRVSNARISFEK